MPKLQALPLFFIAALIFFLCLSESAFAAPMGKLTVSTTPSNASLYIDGQLIGQTPLLKHPLPIGQHTVFLRDQTRQIDQTKIIEIFEGQETVVNISLQKELGNLTVTSKPDSSEVYLLAFMGYTPLNNGKVVPGNYTVEIRKPGDRYLPKRVENLYITNNNPGVIDTPLEKEKFFTFNRNMRLICTAVSACCYWWGGTCGYKEHKYQTITGLTLGTIFLGGTVAF